MTAVALRGDPPPVGGVVAVASGKGGVGKTWLTVSLAYALACEGERVLVVDGDLGLANVDVQLGLLPRSDLSAVVAGRVELVDAVAAAFGGAGSNTGGFDVLPGASGSGALSGAAAEAVSRIAGGVAALSLSYDRVLVDLAAGVEPATLRLAGEADDVLVIVQDEPTAITDAYALIKRLRGRDPGASPRLVVNAADDERAAARAAGAVRGACVKFLGFTPEIAGVISRDAAVPASIRSQTLTALKSPAATAVADVRALARRLRNG